MSKQHGITLFGTMIALLIFAITLIGLQRYQAILSRQFHYYWQQQKAAYLADSLLTGYPHALHQPLFDEWAARGWRYRVSKKSITQTCDDIELQVYAPLGAVVSFSRLFCDNFNQVDN